MSAFVEPKALAKLNELGRLVNEVMKFRTAQARGEIAFDAVPKNANVRMVHEWLSSLHALDAERGSDSKVVRTGQKGKKAGGAS